jgi:S-adenosylmethionine:tRNA ribosyltransferase-isomerase
MHISDFDYELPPELIAREPARPRDASRMMVLKRESGEWIDSSFRRLSEFLLPSDVLVLNDTRVIRSRLRGALIRRNGTTREIEVLFAQPAGVNAWEVMCKPSRRIRTGDRIVFPHGELEGEFGESREFGLRILVLHPLKNSLESVLEEYGHLPLPPYMQREDTPADTIDYQTIFASAPGAVAAPTAGLHFSEAVLEELRARSVEILKLTLHVGIGTFVPVRTEDPHKHILKSERFRMSADTASRLNAARGDGRRIIAVGTTTTRTLEHVFQHHGYFKEGAGETSLFIKPGYEFKAINGMLTNFHLPRSTLLMLVSAFVSRSAILSAYRHAVEMRYRFYSYGDCMLII